MANEEQDQVYSSLLEPGEEEDVSGSEECNFVRSGLGLGQEIDEIRRSSGASKVDLEGEEESEDQDSEYESVVEKFKVKSKKRCKGRKSTWPEQHVNDMINVICSNDNLTRKLIFQNTKNTRNGDLFKKVVEDSQKACQERGENFEFDVKQSRTKFKSCVSLCKTAAMTVKTATGIQRFQDDKNLGQWFNQLYPLVKSRESAQPEQAIEPSASQDVTIDENEDEDSTYGFDLQSETPSPCSSNSVSSDGQTQAKKEPNKVLGKKRKNLFVPVKTYKKKKSDPMAEAVSSFNKLLNNDPTKDLMNFFKDENEKSRQQELELFKLQMQSQMQMQMQMLNKIFRSNSYDQTNQNYIQQPGSFTHAVGRQHPFSGYQPNARGMDLFNHQQGPQQFEMYEMGSQVSENCSTPGKTYMNLQ